MDKEQRTEFLDTMKKHTKVFDGLLGVCFGLIDLLVEKEYLTKWEVQDLIADAKAKAEHDV